MSFTSDNLCCCEYFDIEQERNHILACCCNCPYLDASVDNLLMGKRIPQNLSQNFLLTLLDRLRIPWYGGARKIPPDILASLLLILGTLLIAAINVYCTFVAFTFTFLLICFLSFFCKSIQKTNFFLMCTVISMITLLFIFEMIVVPFLEILIHENVIVVLLLVACLVCICYTKKRSVRPGTEAESTNSSKCIRYCTFCETIVPAQHHYCIWIGCCIGAHNHFFYFFSILFAVISLLYSANLTLTTICRPFRLYKTILLPEDCPEVYEQFEYALSFVSAIFSLCITALLVVRLMYDVIQMVLQCGWKNAFTIQKL